MDYEIPVQLQLKEIKMAAYKNENQYTTLIHEGENVSIDPPGVINAEGSETADLETPLDIKHNGETVASVNNDGDLTLDGTVYIDGDTDIKDLTPIFTVDIVGDYTNNTFTTSTSFADVVEALETGHTVIIRDSNGFVYTQSNSEFDPETTDTIEFCSTQTDGIYYITWTGATREISFVSFSDSGSVVIIEGDGKYQSVVYAEIATVLSDEKIPVINYNDHLYIYNGIGNQRYYFISYRQNAATGDLRDVTCYALEVNETYITLPLSPISFILIQHENVYQIAPKQFYYRGDNYIWSHPTSNNSAYQAGGAEVFNSLKLGTGLYVDFPHVHNTIIYVENGNHHVCWLSEVPAVINVYPNYYKYRCIEPYSNNTIVIYEIDITITAVNTYTVTGTINTYTIPTTT